MEDQPQDGLLGFVESQHLGKEERSKRADGCAHRNSGAFASQRVEGDRRGGRLPVLSVCLGAG